MVNRLHPGMTQADVREVMGTPVLLNTFNENRVDYVYTLRTGCGYCTAKSLTLIFSKGVLREIITNPC